MADKNIVIQRNNGGTIDNVYPQTQWGNVLNKPTTFTPTAHTHTVSDISATGTPSSTTFLRGDGQWATPDGVDNYVNTSGDTMTGDLTLNYSFPRINFTDTDNNSDYSLINDNGTFALYDTTNSLHRVRVLSDGKVGIGATTPAYLLDVNGTARISSTVKMLAGGSYNENLRLSPSSVNDYSSIQLGANATTDSGTQAGQWGLIRYPATTFNNMFSIRHNATDVLNILTGGNVGIGTTNPATKLDVNGVINTNNNISWANGNADINGQDTNLKFRTWTGSALTEKMRILGNGNVGIGTTTPGQALDVVGNIAVSGTVDGVDVSALQTQVNGKLTAIEAFDLTHQNGNAGSWTEVISLSLLANKTYLVTFDAHWYRTYVSASSALVASVNFNDVSGTAPTIRGAFQYSQLDSSTALTLSNTIYTASTSDNQAGNTLTTPTAITAVTRAPFMFRAVVTTGSLARTLRVRSTISGASAPNYTGFYDAVLMAQEI